MRFAAVALVALTGCGDNSKDCGEGTNDDDGDGLCETEPPTNPCGDGTVLDPVNNVCVVDSNVCGDGTVLIRGECRDPSSDVLVDLIEGPEPNGFETNAVPAGTIGTVSSSGFVIRGCVQPVDNDTPDFDVYTITAGGPTLLHIAADGIQGLAAGFQVLSDGTNPLLATWQRLGIDLGGDTSQREILLPDAGVYRIVMTDTRTLLPITSGGEGRPAAGNLDGTSCYFTTLTARPLPAPTAIATGTGEISDELVVFSGPFPSQSADVTAVIDPETPPVTDSRAASSLVLIVDAALSRIDDGDAINTLARIQNINVPGASDALLVLDYVWNVGLQPVPYSITVVP
jgi:hypothetical protein